MMTLAMTREECAKQIYRVASNLRYHIDEVTEIHISVDRDQDDELTYEIDIRQDLATLGQLLKVMDELI